MELQIHTTWTKLGMESQKASLSIKQPRGEQFIKQEKPRLIMEKELPKVIIDQYQCFAEVGLKNITDLNREYAEMGKRAVLEGISRRAEEGDMLANISKGNPIPMIAKQNAFPVYDYNITFIPQSGPKIEVAGHLNIDVQLGEVMTKYTPHYTQIEYNPGNFKIYLQQRGDINIKWFNEKA